ncbi:Hyalin [Holothuria leucospilota]|uniref:Hyalin n=1 Tax=Holothuria leucospilota TaxID=206669 RepID=A0A9Q0YIQ0_HOLLE|nr:Hyalin [Holothuria leucospilota]
MLMTYKSVCLIQTLQTSVCSVPIRGRLDVLSRRKPQNCSTMYSSQRLCFLLQLILYLLIISTSNAQVTIQSCSGDIVTDVLEGAIGAAVTYPLPVTTSVAPGEPTLQTQPPPPGSFFPLGDTLVTYTYRDVFSFEATCSFRITVREVDPCDLAQCLNGGLCIATSVTEFNCVCSGCFIGQSCQIATQACATNPCNGGQCVPRESNCNNFVCRCPPCSFGEFCERSVDACRNNDCVNSAVCVPADTGCSSYTCQCLGCFTGQFCQTAIPNPCNSFPCQNGGTCSRVPDTCSTFQCNCPSGFTGDRCETVTQVVTNPDPCNSFPCRNGVCVPQGAEYVCVCLEGYAGINCDTAVTAFTDRCSTVTCLNGGTCYNSYDSLSGTAVFSPQYCCICAPGFGGQNCATNLNFGGVDQCAVFQGPRCPSVAQCLNKYNSFRETNGYFCNCPVGLIGFDCSIPYFDPCSNNPCANGLCVPFFRYFICQCFPPFGGPNCDSIVDNTPPVVQNCPGDFTVRGTSDFPGYAVVNWAEPIAFDVVSDVLRVTRSREPGALYAYGETVFVEYTFTDEAGNTATCSFIVQVQAPPVNTPPTAPICPPVPSVVSFTGDIGNFVTWTIGSCDDAEDGSITPVCDPASGSFFNVGSTPVTCTCTDSGGLTRQCPLNAVVVMANTPPSTPNCPVVPAVVSFTGDIGNFVTWTIGACTDAEDGSITPVCDPASGSFFNVGSTPVTCTCTDSGSLTSDCGFNAIVLEANTPPSVPVCPFDPSATGLSQTFGNFVSWTIQDCSDTQDGIITPMCNPMSGSFFNLGSNPVTCTCTDSDGLMTDCTFNAIVNTPGSPPTVVDCPESPITQTVPFDSNSGTVTWQEPSATSNTGGTITVIQNRFPGSVFFIGETEVTYTFTDNPSGLTETCTFVVVVQRGDDTTPPVVNCPADTVDSIDITLSEMEVVFAEPSATDNSGIVFVQSQSHTPGNFFPPGLSTVTYVFSDTSGNTAECQFNVILERTQGVVISPTLQILDCPVGDIVRTAPLGATSLSVTWVEPTAISNSPLDNIVLTSNPPDPGTSFSVPSRTPVLYRFLNGRTSMVGECQFDIVINGGSTGFTFNNCPTVIRESGLPGSSFVMVTWPDITALTPRGTQAELFDQTRFSGSFFDVGTTAEVTYTFLDPVTGVTDTCTFIVDTTPTANTPPSSPVCPPDTFENSMAGNIGNFVSWTIGACTDVQDGSITPVCDPMSGSFFNVGSTPVTCTCTDLGGLSSQCSFDVVVIGQNTPPPMPVCPSVSPVVTFSGNIGNFVSWTIGPCDDAEDGNITPVCDPMSDSFFSVGSTPVTCTCTDSGSLSSQCTFDAVVVPENTPPSDPVCPIVSPVESFVGNIGNFVSWTIGACTDAQDGSITPVCDPMSDSFFSVGSTLVTCTCTDSGGLSSQCTFNALVVGQNTPPSTPVCPTVPSVISLDGNIGNFVSWTIGACTDAQDGSITPVCDPMSDSFFSIGPTQVTCTCTDSGGLSSECNFNVVVVGQNTPPSTPVCPTNPSAISLDDNIGNFVSWTIGACTDAQDGSITPVCDPVSGSFFSIGPTQVTCTCTDSGGLSSECDFNVVVVEQNTPPSTPVCPTVSPVISLDDNIGNFVSWTIGACTDTQDGSITPVCDPVSGSFFSVGSTQVTCTCTDSGGLSSQCTFNVVVFEQNTPPSTPVCPTVPSVISLDDNIGNFVSWTIGACTDAQDGSITPVCDPMSGAFFSVGSTLVTCTCTDSGGLSSDCSFSAVVIVVNTVPLDPVCPSVPPVVSFTGNIGNFVSWTIGTCTDAQDGSITPVCEPMSNSFFSVGSTPVTCTCTDSGGLTSDCGFNAIVLGANTPPSDPDCPNVAPVVSFTGNIGNFVSWTIGACTDVQDGSVTPVCDPMSNSFFSVGSTLVTCTCTDSGGLSSGCSFNAVVTGSNRPPSMPSCPSVAPVNGLGVGVGNFVSWTIGACTDAEDGSTTPVCNPMSDSFFSVGSTPVTCTCTDSGGLSSACTFNAVVIEVNTPPSTPSCPSVAPVTGLGGTVGNFVSWTIGACTDAQDGSITPVCDPMSDSFFSVGPTQVTCTCTDSGGLSSECSFTVVVTTALNPPPDPMCPIVAPASSLPGNIGNTVTWTIPACIDSEDGAITPVCSEVSGSLFPVGDNIVTCTCTDSDSLTSTCTFVVRVSSVGPLMCLNVPEPIVMFVDPGVSGSLVSWVEPTCSSPLATITCSESSPQFIFTGTTNAVLCMCSVGANTVSCVFTVAVMTSGPVNIQVMNCPNAPIQVTPPSGSSTIPVVWSAPFALTNSGDRANILSQTHAPGDLFDIPSVTQVTYVFEAFGAMEVCTFQVRVAQPAVVTIVQPCPTDFTTFANPGVLSIPISWTPPTAVNGNGAVVPVAFQSHFPGSLFSVPSTTTVTYVFSDSGASATCSFRITANIRIVPPTIINCPDDIQTTATVGTSVGVTWEPITAVTPTGQLGVLTSATHNSGDLFPIGKTGVTIVFSDPDASQNTATCQFQVCVSAPPDPPTLVSCPTDITQTANTLTTPVAVFWAPPTAVTSAGSFAIVTMRTHMSGDTFPIGTTPVSITLTDPVQFGQSVACTFQVTIFPPITPPVLTNCPNDITLTSTSGGGVTVVYDVPTAVTQGGQPAALISQSHFPGQVFPVGKTIVRYTFGDPTTTSSTTECVFCITIELVLSPPVITSCPGRTQTTSATGGSVSVSWAAPAAVSGGQIARLLSQTHFPGSLFPVGVTNVQYIFSDPNNVAVTSTCEFDVEVLGPPTLINCPADITEVSSSGTGLVITWNPPSAVTSQGFVAQMQSQTHTSGQFLPVGITCVEIIFIDPASGLTVSCLFKIIILGPPVITGCPADQTVTSVQNTVSVTWVPPTAVSTRGIPLAPSATRAPGSLFPSPSTTIVTYSFTDPESGLTNQCVFTVTVIRPDPPTLVSCPSDITMSGALGTNVPVTFIPPSAVSQGQIVPCVSSQQVPPVFLVPSMTTIVYTCTDVRGLSVTCAFDIVITVQQSPPTVSRCPTDFMLEGPRGAASVQVTWIEPTAVTSSGLPADVSSNFSPGNEFPIPTNVAVTYIFTDPQSGLQDNSCSFFIVITVPPAIVAPTVLGCPADVELDVNNAETVSVSWTEPTAVSNTPGGTVTVTSTRVSGSTFLVPSTELVVYTFSDSFAPGLTTECRFTVTVTGVDTIPPTIQNCPGNIVLTIMEDVPTQVVAWIPPTATDRGQPVAGTSNFDPGDQFPTRTSTGVLYSFIDQAGNENRCTFAVSVIVRDIEPPVVSNCPEVISVTAAINQQVVPLTWDEPTAVDNFGGGVSVTRTHMPGDAFMVDTSTLVTYLFTDAAGNTAVCIFAVSVTSAPDDPPNIVFCPSNILRTAAAGATTLSVVWQEPLAQDDSGFPVGVISSHMIGDRFVVGDTTTVLYTFTDNAGQVAVCTFTVTVTAPPDTNPPAVTNCPMSVLFERVATGSPIVLVDWEEPVATDQESVVTVVQSHVPPLSLPVGSTVLVTYTFSDQSGNSAVCSFTIFVLPADSTPPVFMNCPTDIRVPARVTDVATSAVAWLEPVAMDVSSEPVVVTVNFPPGTEFVIGTPVTVVYTATDSATIPNTAECTFTVEVLPFDNVDPVIINCPTPITVSVLPSFTTAAVFWVPPMTVDIATFTSNFQPGNEFLADTTTEVIYTLTDTSGNTATCDFTVTVVRDGNPPALQQPCPRLDIEMSFPIGIGEVPIATLWPAPVAVEPFLQVTTTATVDPDYFNFQNGFLPVDGVQRQVRYRFMDSLGNAQDCVFFVTLTEDTGPAPPPVFTTCPPTVLFTLTAQTGATASRTWPVVEAVDPNGGPITITTTPDNVDSFPVGSTTVTITATNDEGTSSSCVFFVLVTADDIPPVANCPVEVREVLPMDETTVVVTWNVEFTDNSLTVTVMQDGPRSGDSFGVGTAVVMYTASDAAGNVATCTFNVIVSADPGITITPTNCPSTFTAFTNDPSLQAVMFPQITAVDENGITLMGVLTNPPDNSFTPTNPVQVQTVTFTFMDGAGQTALCMIELSFTLDRTSPTFGNCPQGNTLSGTLPQGATTVSIPAVQMISAVDDSNMSPTVTTNPADVTSFPFGTTPVTFTATDVAGNTAQCTFTVEVNAAPCTPNPCEFPLTQVCTPVIADNTFTCADDVDPPTFFNCPTTPIQATPPPGQNTVVVTIPVVTATDNLDTDLISASNAPAGNVFTAGTTSVTITFTDDAGNVATCMFDVQVDDVVPPEIQGCPSPNPISVSLPPGQDMVTVPQLTVTDNLDVNPMVIRVPDSNSFPAGITPVSVTATDASGNIDTCAYNVEVSSPCDAVLCAPPSSCRNTVGGPTCGVSCEFAPCNSQSNFCIEITPGVGTCTGDTVECMTICPVPTPTLSCQAGRCISSPLLRTDCNGGCLVGQTCSFGVCVIDTDPPTANCPADITGDLPPNQQTVTIALPVTANDALDPNPAILISPVDNQFSAGSTIVAVTAIDDAGNMDTCTFNVIVTAAVVDPCDPNPCLNGGTCNPSGNSFFCLCESGFSGNTCAMMDPDPCDPSPCAGTTEVCSATGGVAVCTDVCAPNPCQGATEVCSLSNGAAQCTDLCSPNLCPAQASNCYVTVAGVQQCTAGHPCQAAIPPCLVNQPCFPLPNNLFMCGDACNPSPCQGATEVCSISIGGAAMCTDLCDPTPCQGATQVCSVVNSVTLCTDFCNPTSCTGATEVCSVINNVGQCTDVCDPTPCQGATEVCSLSNGVAQCTGRYG